MWHPFRKHVAGPLPQVTWNGGAFPFQASAGHNYDTWFWPYPSQTNQYTYFNAFYGNQLPSFNTFIPVLHQPDNQVQPSWLTPWDTQRQNALQAAGRGSTHLMWGQQPTADYISSISQFWANQAKGGRR